MLWIILKNKEKDEDEELQRNEGRIIIQDVQITGIEGITIVHQTDREAEMNNLQNLYNAKLKVSSTDVFNSTNNKNSDKINFNKKNDYTNILYKNKNFEDYFKINKDRRIKKFYDIFYFIGRRNIYAILFIFSYPYNPK